MRRKDSRNLLLVLSELMDGKFKVGRSAFWLQSCKIYFICKTTSSREAWGLMLRKDEFYVYCKIIHCDHYLIITDNQNDLKLQFLNEIKSVILDTCCFYRLINTSYIAYIIWKSNNNLYISILRIWIVMQYKMYGWVDSRKVLGKCKAQLFVNFK